MTGFYVTAALLLVFAAGFVSWPLLRRARLERTESRKQVNVELYREHLRELDASLAAGALNQQQYAELKRELDLSLLDDDSVSGRQLNASLAGRWLLWLAALLLLPLCSIWYWHFGAHDDVQVADLIAQRSVAEYLVQYQAVDEARLQQLSADLQAELEQSLGKRPDNTQNWYLLARLAMEQGRYADGVAAYGQILQREPESVQIRAELAQAQFLAAGNRLNPGIEALVEQVLAADPQNPTALGLAGIAAFEKADYAQAIKHWRATLAVMGADSPGAEALKAGIAKAQSLLGGTTEKQLAESGQPGVSIKVSVALADSVSVSADQAVYVYARQWGENAPKMPLAIAKLRVADLPAEVELTDAMAMMPNMKLSTFTQVELVARVSQSGSANAASGDWQGVLGPVNVADPGADLALVVAEQIP